MKFRIILFSNFKILLEKSSTSNYKSLNLLETDDTLDTFPKNQHK